MNDVERQSQEYHSAHLAFSRSTIVERAASGQRIFDLLKIYTDDVVKAERDRRDDEDAREQGVPTHKDSVEMNRLEEQ